MKLGLVVLLLILSLTPAVVAKSSVAEQAEELTTALRNAESTEDAEAAFMVILDALRIPVLDPGIEDSTPGLYPFEISLIVDSFRAGHLTALDELVWMWRQEDLMCGNQPCTADIVENGLRMLRRNAVSAPDNPDYLLVSIVDALGQRDKLPFSLLQPPSMKCLDNSGAFAAALGAGSIPDASMFQGMDSSFGASGLSGYGIPADAEPLYGGALPGMGNINDMMAQMISAALLQAQQEAEEEEDDDTLAMLQMLNSSEGMQAMMGLMQGGGTPQSALPLLYLIDPEQAAEVEQQLQQRPASPPGIPSGAASNPLAGTYIQSIQELQSFGYQPLGKASGKDVAEQTLRFSTVDLQRRYSAWQMMLQHSQMQAQADRAALDDPEADDLFTVDLSEVVAYITTRSYEDSYEEGKWLDQMVRYDVEDVLEDDIDQVPVGFPIAVEERKSCIFLDSVQLFLVQWDLVFRSPLTEGGAVR
ncbi:MAG: hypothetical protein ACOX44_10955 [Limnochordia bacterium]